MKKEKVAHLGTLTELLELENDPENGQEHSLGGREGDKRKEVSPGVEEVKERSFDGEGQGKGHGVSKEAKKDSKVLKVLE